MNLKYCKEHVCFFSLPAASFQVLSLPVDNVFSFEFYDSIKMLIIFLAGYIYFNSLTIILDLA